MASFEIAWRSSTKKDLRRLPRDEVPRITAAVSELAEEPLLYGSEKLTGAEHTYRISRRRLSRGLRASPRGAGCRDSASATQERRLQMTR